jgi:flavodoxin
MKTNRIIAALLLIAGLLCLQPETVPAQGVAVKQDNATVAQDETAKPFIVYYSRTGSAQKVASALQNQLGCGMEGIVPASKIGIGTIFMDQIFNRKNKQEPLKQNLAEYDPIILVTPIWFMRLSSPARAFIKQGALKGKEVYIFTVSGGPMSKGRKNAFKEFGAEHGLTVKEVHSLQVGKKTPADLEKEIKESISGGSLKKYRN